jgi:hypothetical protein
VQLNGGKRLSFVFWLTKGLELIWGIKRRRTPLSFAAQDGNEAIVRLLLDKGAQSDSRVWHEVTPLAYAAQRGSETIVRLLLEKGAGAQIDWGDEDGVTPLACAAREGEEAVVRLLLEKGADFNVRDNRGFSALGRVHSVIAELNRVRGYRLRIRNCEIVKDMLTQHGSVL